MSQIKIEFKKN